jgi:hypothetical protein
MLILAFSAAVERRKVWSYVEFKIIRDACALQGIFIPAFDCQLTVLYMMLGRTMMMNALNSTGQISARHSAPNNQSANSPERRLAWQSSQFLHENDLVMDREHILTFPTGKPPLPPVLSQAAAPSEVSTQRTPMNKKDDELLEEW